MAVIVEKSVWDGVLELTKSAQDKGSDPSNWAIQLSTILNSAGVSMPSTDLASFLVSHICWDNNAPITWKFLDKALTMKIVPPMLVLALLSTRYSFLFSLYQLIYISLFLFIYTFFFDF
ncbi:hypothetical protein CsSME_00047185 [Camellia sinensis var. sinensis]